MSYAPKPPIESLVDAFTYKAKVGEDNWGTSIYGKPQSVSKCRIDRHTKYSFANGERQLAYNAIIFVYPSIDGAGIEFKTKGQVVFDDSEYIITDVIKNTEPFSSDVYSYELEVI